MALSLKDGVQFTDISDRIVDVLPLIDKIYRCYGQTVVITSARDGLHKTGSKHYSGEAIDLRNHYFKEWEKKDVFRDLQCVLGEDFDVVWESTHFHCEYDPK